jgi:hypothetical protein
VLALEDVTHDDRPQRRGGRGGDITNGPAHAVSVSARPRPETDSTPGCTRNALASCPGRADPQHRDRRFLRPARCKG